MGKDEKRPQEISQPPDGGWGWMIVFGSALSHGFCLKCHSDHLPSTVENKAKLLFKVATTICRTIMFIKVHYLLNFSLTMSIAVVMDETSQMFLIPLLQNFTLIFNDRFIELDFTSTEITTLVSLNASFGMIIGLLNGPLLKTFGYRKMALVGLSIYIIGILCTGIARSYTEFIIFYGLLSSLGMVMAMASFSLAINSYFQKKRSKAVGYAMTLTGLGPIIMPYVISYLLASFGLKWTVFLLSGLNLHAYIGALLLQPVKWHMKLQNQPILQDDNENKMLLSDVHSFLELSAWGSRMSLPSQTADHLIKSRKSHSRELPQVKEERHKPRKLSLTTLDNDDYKNMMNSTLHMIESVGINEKDIKFASAETLSLEGLDGEGRNELLKNLLGSQNPKVENESTKLENSPPLEKNVARLFFRFIRFLQNIYDLDLLHDPFYVNIMLGLSLAFVGEIVFSTMTPVILREIGFDIDSTATFMSVIASCDLFCRFIAPFAEKKFNLNSKRMYLIALLILLVCRAGLYLASNYETCLLISFGLGVGKGFRSVYWVLVLPDYVPLSKLPSASAIQSLVNGILILVSGPLIGAIVSTTNSYLSIIVASNVLTLTTILLWGGEIIYLKCKKKS